MRIGYSSYASFCHKAHTHPYLSNELANYYFVAAVATIVSIITVVVVDAVVGKVLVIRVRCFVGADTILVIRVIDCLGLQSHVYLVFEVDFP